MLFKKKILAAYKKTAFSRYDGDGLAAYFSHEDFPGLSCREVPFPSRHGHTLAGYLYSYQIPREGRLIVFDHGFGGGHRSYMKEIELLCRHGFLVFAYDHTGCMASGGEGTRGMSGSITDLDDALSFIKKDARFAGLSIAVVGHSWGGYATALAPALHPDLSHIVILSGAISLRAIVRTFLGGLLALYRPAVAKLEREANPNTADLNAPDLLKDTKTKVLAIYSKDDPLIRMKLHYKPLQKALSGKANARLLLVDNKGHNPNYTEAAVKCLAAYGKEKGLFRREHPHATEEEKAAFRARFDWHAMTEQDSAVWSEIFAWLDN